VDRQIRRLGLAFLALFTVLFGQITWVQVVRADRIADNPANAKRQLIAEYSVARGPILTSDGVVIALSRASRGELVYQRRYPSGPLYAGITGFYSFVFGKSELELAVDDYLNGDAPELAAQTFADLVLGRPKKGATVVTTIRSDLQQVAARALGDQRGAVVALDPATGNILAMVTNPSFDPNPISSQDPQLVRDTWDEYLADPDEPTTDRANDQVYPPGSTFKIVTAAAALENGYAPDTRVPNPTELDLPLTDETLENFGGSRCPGGTTISLAEAFRVSCNVAFGGIGLDLGAERLAAQARAFGFCATDPPAETACIDPTIPFTIPFATGRFPVPPYFEQNDPLVAISAIGQDNVLANPLQMALVGAAVANDGVMMRPNLISEIRDPTGRVVRRFEPRVYGEPISEPTARALQAMMETVVESGTGQAARIPGVPVAGKTGTAQHGKGVAPHAWFVSFAPVDNPVIVVAVIVEDGGDLGDEATGGQVAAPIARDVVAAYLGAEP
jgi:peptidoglycan glycosyltransferase